MNQVVINANAFGTLLSCSHCGLNYRVGTAHSCLLTLQEQMKSNQNGFLAEIQEIQRVVQAAFLSRDTIIEGLRKEIVNVTRQNAEMQREILALKNAQANFKAPIQPQFSRVGVQPQQIQQLKSTTTSFKIRDPPISLSNMGSESQSQTSNPDEDMRSQNSQQAQLTGFADRQDFGVQNFNVVPRYPPANFQSNFNNLATNNQLSQPDYSKQGIQMSQNVNRKPLEDESALKSFLPVNSITQDQRPNFGNNQSIFTASNDLYSDRAKENHGHKIEQEFQRSAFDSESSHSQSQQQPNTFQTDPPIQQTNNGGFREFAKSTLMHLKNKNIKQAQLGNNMAEQVAYYIGQRGVDNIDQLGYRWVQMNAGKVDSQEKSNIVGTILKAFANSNAVGSFNFWNGKLWGSFLIKQEECYRLRDITHQFQTVMFNELDNSNDSHLIERCPSDWAKADQFLLF